MDRKIMKVVILANEVSIDFDDKSDLKILLDTFLDFNLYENKIINQDIYNEILDKNNYNKLKNYAYYLLKFRDYCEKEMFISLYKYEPNEVSINKIINELKQKNYLNDYNYAKYALEKMFNKGFSKARAIKELFEFEINQDIINELIIDYDEEEILTKKTKKLFAQIYSKKTLENTKKDIYQKCLYEGFESSQVISIIDNICDDLDNNNHDFQMLLQDYNKLKRINKNDCDKNDFKVKLTRKLLQKGHSYEQICELIGKDDFKDD